MRSSLHPLFLALAVAQGFTATWLWSLSVDSTPAHAFWLGALALALAVGAAWALTVAEKEMD